MFAHFRPSCAAPEPAAPTPLQIRFGVGAILPGLALLLASCTNAPPVPATGPDPSNPRARAPRVDYRSTLGSYKSQRPVEPGPWGEQNRSVPQPKSPHEGHR
jgi:hypothetical protein